MLYIGEIFLIFLIILLFVQRFPPREPLREQLLRIWRDNRDLKQWLFSYESSIQEIGDYDQTRLITAVEVIQTKEFQLTMDDEFTIWRGDTSLGRTPRQIYYALLSEETSKHLQKYQFEVGTPIGAVIRAMQGDGWLFLKLGTCLLVPTKDKIVNRAIIQKGETTLLVEFK